MTKTMTWKLGNGMTAEATVTATARISSETVADGFGGRIETGRRDVIVNTTITATLDGAAEYTGSQIENVKANNLGIVGGLGRIALKQDKHDELTALIAAVNEAAKTDEMKAIQAEKKAALEASIAADMAYDAADARIRAAL